MAVTLNDLTWRFRCPIGGERGYVEFPNGWAASVLRGGIHAYTAGGTYEVAVMLNGTPNYSTPITDNVLGYLTEDEANQALADIAALPDVEAKQ